jgi:hypothetical protein
MLHFRFRFYFGIEAVDAVAKQGGIGLIVVGVKEKQEKLSA